MLKTRTMLAAAAMFMAPVGLSQTVAGDIDAEIIDGHLFIYGDDDDSSISITSTSQYSITVAGQTTTSGESTFVNGEENGTVVLNGWTRGIFVYNYGGDDAVDMQNLTSAGPVTIDQGLGDDQVMIGTNEINESLLGLSGGDADALILDGSTVTLNSYLLIITSDGADDVMIRNTTVARTMTVDLGAGDDYFMAGGGEIVQAMFGNNSYIVPGIGADEIELQGVTFERNLVIDDATGPLTLNVMDTEVAESSFVYATPDNDEIMASNWNMGDFLLMITESGDDTISYSGDSADATFYTNAGNDRVELYDIESGNIIVQMATGDDRVWLSNSMLNRFDLYGSADNDFFKVRSTTASEGYIYGASGTDTVQESTLFPNAIGTYREYSIENNTSSVR